MFDTSRQHANVMRPSPQGIFRALFLVLAVLPVLVFFFYPLAETVSRSFTPDGTVGWHSWTLGHYTTLFRGRLQRHILANTFGIALEGTVATAILAFPMATSLYRMSRRRALVIIAALLLPSWTSFIVALYGLSLLLRPVGLLYTHWGTVVGMVVYLLPYTVVMMYAGMLSAEGQLLDAGRSLGASWTQVFRHIFWPLIRPGVVSSLLVTFVIGLAFFLTPAIIGGPGDITGAVFIQQSITVYDWSGAATFGTVLFVVAILLYALAARLVGLDKLAGGGSSGRGVASMSALAWPRGLRWALRMSMWVGVAVVYVPLFAVIPASFSQGYQLALIPSGFSLRWYQAAWSDSAWWESVVLSGKVAVISAGVVVLLSLAAAVSMTRVLKRGRSLLRLLLMGPLIIPIILYAIALYSLESKFHLVGSIWGYVIADSMIALPFGATIMITALDSVGMETELAARTLGASPIEAFFKITLPMVRGPLLSAATIALLMSWGETVISVILAGTTPTFPVRVYDFMQVELTPETAALSGIVTFGLLILAVGGWAASRFAPKRQKVSLQ